MQNVLYRLSDTPGEIKWTGRKKGADNAAVFAELGLTDDQIAGLVEHGIV